MSAPRPVVLCILDGWGISPEREGNAPLLAHTPNFDRLMSQAPHSQLITFGPDVGLPKGQMGNSEVGHMNIGAGRVVAMDLGQIDLAIESHSYAAEPAITRFISRLRESGGRAHLLALLSDGGVHGHIHHLIATIELLREAGVPYVLHAVTDGRDVAPKSASRYLSQLRDALPCDPTLGTLSGRYFALDRDNRWDRVEKAFAAISMGQGPCAPDAGTAIDLAYDQGLTDEFIPPTVMEGYGGMEEGDGLFCLNFRADRAREILEAFGNPEFTGFSRKMPNLAARLGMVDYSDRHNDWYEAVFPKKTVKNTLAHWIATKGLRQFHVAETEKYPHVTFFLNGGMEAPEKGEERVMPPSPKVATYDLMPEMSAGEVTDALTGAIEEGFDFIVVNFANPDMVGHTGNLEAAIAACEAVDEGLGRAMTALEAAGGAIIVTADHGNCETMIDPRTGGPHTAHTLNPVPVLVWGGPEGAHLRPGRLADLAPTVLDLMGIDKPAEMTGTSLLEK